MNYGSSLIAITSGHVHRIVKPHVGELCKEPPDPYSCKVISPELDFAFFTFSETAVDKNNDDVFNLMPLKYIGSVNELRLTIGEPVYKIGRSTGLTEGTLLAFQSTFRSTSGGTYTDHVRVKWNQDDSRFAFSMDCGALYCVKRGHLYVPIGIHRTSDIGESYGCPMWKVMELFPEEVEYLEYQQEYSTSTWEIWRSEHQQQQNVWCKSGGDDIQLVPTPKLY